MFLGFQASKPKLKTHLCYLQYYGNHDGNILKHSQLCNYANPNTIQPCIYAITIHLVNYVSMSHPSYLANHASISRPSYLVNHASGLLLLWVVILQFDGIGALVALVIAI